MNHKPQRLRMTEPGWKTYTGHFGGVEFNEGLSTEVVDLVTATRLGSLIRLQMVDSDTQAGQAAALLAIQNTRAPVVQPLQGVSEEQTPASVETPKPKHTREELEAVADSRGIAGLRDIATPLGIKGRGIPELIEEILADQVKRA